MKIICRSVVIVLVVFAVLFAYGAFEQSGASEPRTSENTNQPVELSKRPSTSLAAQGNNKTTDDNRPLYYFGVPPYQKGKSFDKVRALYRPMLTWLGDQAGCRFEVIGGETYEEMTKMVVDGKVQLAELGPVTYLLAKQQNPKIKTLVTELKWDEEKKRAIDSYRGYILVLKTREDLKTLGDLKDKKFAFVNRQSTTGYRYPKALLRERSIIPDTFFGKIYFLGSHPRVTDAIAAGSVDAGATWDFNWSQAVKKHGDVFKPIFKTPPIPNLNMVAHSSLPDDISLKIQKILPTIDPSLLKGLPFSGFVVRPDSFYDGMRILTEQKGE